MTPEEIRHSAVEIARSVVGLGSDPGDADRRLRYAALIAPGEPPARAEAMIAAPGGGLVAAAILRRLGLDGQPELAAPYVDGTSVSRLVALAKRLGAWVPFAEGRYPSPGDVVIVGGAAGGPEHAYTITASWPGATILFESVDGGQRDAGGNWTILAKKRVWRGAADLVWQETEPGVTGPRGVAGHIDVTKLLGGPPAESTTPPSDRWLDYAPRSGAPQQGQPLPAELAARILAARAAVPVVPELRPMSGKRNGYMYGGGEDHAHLQYLDGYLDAAAAAAGGRVERMKIEAFRALLRREGSTTAINTYDNMVVTWGLGFGGYGLLGAVMGRVMQSAVVQGLFDRCGLRPGADAFRVVDLASGRVVSDRDDALEIVRGSLPLLYLLIQAARGPETRDAVTAAQLSVFSAQSASHQGAEEIGTQALFTFVTHLKHWAPDYAVGAVPWAVAQVGGGDPGEVRDRRLAPLIGRYFYGRAKGRWTPSWTQFQGYALRDLKADGLDCSADPWFCAGGPTDVPDVRGGG